MEALLSTTSHWSNRPGGLVCPWPCPTPPGPPFTVPQQPLAAFREGQGCETPPPPSPWSSAWIIWPLKAKALCLLRIPSEPVAEPKGDSETSPEPCSRGLLFYGLSSRVRSRSISLQPTPSITKGNLLPLKIRSSNSDSSWGLLGIWRFSPLCFSPLKICKVTCFSPAGQVAGRNASGLAALWGPSRSPLRQS